MKQVTSFNDDKLINLQRRINEWLFTHSTFKIINTQYQVVRSNCGNESHYVLIFYEEQ